MAILQWIRAFGEQLEAIKRDDPFAVMELDEMHSYIGSKKSYCWIWIAIDRDRQRFLDCVLGSRDTITGEKLWGSIAPLAAGEVMTDYWRPYEAFAPPMQHIQSKAETCTIEGYNRSFRHFLARLCHKSKCFISNAKYFVLAPVTSLTLHKPLCCCLQHGYGLESEQWDRREAALCL